MLGPHLAPLVNVPSHTREAFLLIAAPWRSKRLPQGHWRDRLSPRSDSGQFSMMSCTPGGDIPTVVCSAVQPSVQVVN